MDASSIKLFCFLMPPYIHKRFRRLAIYVSDEACAALPFRQMLSAPLGAYYSCYLKGPSFQGIHSINLYLTSLAAEQGQLEKQVVGYLDYYPSFDFQAFAQLATNQQRQYALLDTIQQAVRQIVQQEGWEVTRFEQAYQACLHQELPVEVRY
jgi:hypothetical protein